MFRGHWSGVEMGALTFIQRTKLSITSGDNHPAPLPHSCPDHSLGDLSWQRRASHRRSPIQLFPPLHTADHSAREVGGRVSLHIWQVVGCVQRREESAGAPLMPGKVSGVTLVSDLGSCGEGAEWISPPVMVSFVVWMKPPSLIWCDDYKEQLVNQGSIAFTPLSICRTIFFCTTGTASPPT